MPRTDALIALVIPHTFRFVGLSFLIPGVVSPSLSPAFAVPAAYGELVGAILAGIATLALAARASWAIPMVWLFNLWGTLDLLHAIYDGQIGVYEGLVDIAPTLGALAGRAAAVADARDAATGWTMLTAIPDDAVTNYQPYWALRAHLLKRLQRESEAAEAYTRAIGLCEDAAMREFLLEQAGR